MKTMGPTNLEAALKEFDKKFKDKSGHTWDDRHAEPKKNKYTFIEKSYEDDDDEATANVKKEEDADDDVERKEDTKSELPVQIQRLVELIFNQSHFNSVLESIGYNAEKLPLGKLGKSTLKQGFEHLRELASLIKHPSLAQNKYGVDQREVSTVRPARLSGEQPLMLTYKLFRPSRTSPTDTTPPFLTSSAGIVPR